MLAAVQVAFAQSGPEQLIPQPVEYTVGDGVYAPENDGSDIKTFVGDRSFAALTADMPEFARKEAYKLIVGKKGIKIYANTEEGAFRASQTLRMLRLLDDDIRHCTIIDYPRFQHRGIMLDESRSFKGKDFVKKQIDALIASVGTEG